MLDQFPHATEELAWRYLRADALVGIRGQVVDGGSRSSGVDSAGIGRMHDARIRPGHREALEKRQKVDELLAKLDDTHRVTIDRTFEPFGRATQTLAACFTHRGLVLVRVAMNTNAANSAYETKFGGAATNGWDLLEWLEKEARSVARSEAEIRRARTKKPSNHVFERILNESVVIVTHAVRAYDAVRTAQYLDHQRKQTELLNRELKALDNKLWGTPP